MVFKNVKLYRDGTLQTVDIEVADGKIVAIEEELHSDRVFDGRGSLLLNGVTDLNIYPKDRKISAIESLEKMAVESGITGVRVPSDLETLIDREERVTLLQSVSKNGSTELSISGVDSSGNLSNIAKLSKDSRFIEVESDIDGNSLRRVYQYAQMLNLTVIVKIQSREVWSDGMLHDTETAFRLGMPSRDAIGEISEVSKTVQYSRKFKVETVLIGVTDREAIDIVIRAKREGDKVLLLADIHHLLFDDSIYFGFNNYTKVEPPFQSRENMEYLQELLISGDIDLISMGHSEISQSFKSGSFKEASSGTPNLESPLSILYSKFVKSGQIEREEFIKLFENGRKLFQIDEVEVGKSPSFTLFLESESVEIKNPESIYSGESYSGRVVATVSECELVYEHPFK